MMLWFARGSSLRLLFVGVIVALLLGGRASAQEDARNFELPSGRQPHWYKGNLHTHSLWSDGNDFPEMVVDWYVRNGYHFLSLTEHNVLSRGGRWINIGEVDSKSQRMGFTRYVRRMGRQWVETRYRDGQPQVRLKPLSEFRSLFERPGEFMLLQGEEITDQLNGRPIHLNATNLASLIAPQGGSDVLDVIHRNLRAIESQAREERQPILGLLNHPNFHFAITAEQIAEATQVRFFEVYNGHPSTSHRGSDVHPDVERMWDIVNTLRIAEFGAAPVLGLATDDAHEYYGRPGATPGRGWIQVRARFLTPEAILRAINLGDFYASSGVTLSQVFYDPVRRRLDIEVQPEPEASYTIQFIGTLQGYDEQRIATYVTTDPDFPAPFEYSKDIGQVLSKTEGLKASYQLSGRELYVRAVVTSSLPPPNPMYEGQKAQAWTQPVGWVPRLVRSGGIPQVGPPWPPPRRPSGPGQARPSSEEPGPSSP